MFVVDAAAENVAEVDIEVVEFLIEVQRVLGTPLVLRPTVSSLRISVLKRMVCCVVSKSLERPIPWLPFWVACVRLVPRLVSLTLWVRLSALIDLRCLMLPALMRVLPWLTMLRICMTLSWLSVLILIRMTVLLGLARMRVWNWVTLRVTVWMPSLSYVWVLRRYLTRLLASS